MINILTKAIDGSIIKDFEAFFDSNVFANSFNTLDEEVLLRVDGATMLDKKTGSVNTKFGLTDVLHLSTGCKVILSYLYIRKNKTEYSGVMLDVTECGSNALEVLFDCVEQLEDKETIFILRHSNQLYKCKDRDYNINGEYSNNLQEGVLLNA